MPRADDWTTAPATRPALPQPPFLESPPCPALAERTPFEPSLNKLDHAFFEPLGTGAW